MKLHPETCMACLGCPGYRIEPCGFCAEQKDLEMNFDVENSRRHLIALRVRFGADTAKGHRCSNLIEQIKNLEAATGEQRANLQASIRKSIAELNAPDPK